MLTVVMLCCW